MFIKNDLKKYLDTYFLFKDDKFYIFNFNDSQFSNLDDEFSSNDYIIKDTIVDVFDYIDDINNEKELNNLIVTEDLSDLYGDIIRVKLVRADNNEEEYLEFSGDSALSNAQDYIDKLKIDNDDFFKHAELLDEDDLVLDSWDFISNVTENCDTQTINEDLTDDITSIPKFSEIQEDAVKYLKTLKNSKYAEEILGALLMYSSDVNFDVSAGGSPKLFNNKGIYIYPKDPKSEMRLEIELDTSSRYGKTNISLSLNLGLDKDSDEFKDLRDRNQIDENGFAKYEDETSPMIIDLLTEWDQYDFNQFIKDAIREFKRLTKDDTYNSNRNKRGSDKNISNDIVNAKNKDELIDALKNKFNLNNVEDELKKSITYNNNEFYNKLMKTIISDRQLKTDISNLKKFDDVINYIKSDIINYYTNR